ncbi:tetratricopeptide repeat protein [Chryseobacterium sp. SSA4.19]|uniref:histidine kinase dimerization/phosphoacceptor domain -containing protein n=1 Tax=Chryseobacterium sp. SSA4.19 TaxID=2919915 RepID=UPI001F4DCBC0|nr:histidine kinase dimerization/phosphoacceptor domain -containing protein [Chryseobacterium sp. SSA4.19]MCJ8153024.1 tetratricopeptide repeat protein [Chryseobacterium sp. SSA4.19]
MKIWFKLAFILCAFTFLSAQIKAQTKENPVMLLRQISFSENNKQKTDFFLRLGEFYLTKAGEYKKDLDSAELCIKEAVKLNKFTGDKLDKGKIMFLDARIDKERARWEIATAKMKKSLNYFLAYNFEEQAGDVYSELSYMSNNDPENLTIKIRLKEKAIYCFARTRKLIKQANVLKDLAEIYSIKEDPDKAIAILKQSLSTFQFAKYKKVQMVYKLLSLAEVQKGDYKEALRYAHLAEKTAVHVGDHSVDMSSIYNQVGLVYYYLDKYDEATDYYERALVVAKRNNDIPFIRTAASNISVLLISQKKYQEGIGMIKQYKKLYPHEDKEFEMYENDILLHTYTIIKQIKDADVYYRKLVHHYGEYGEKANRRASVLYGFSMYHFQKKDYKSFYKSVKLFDSITAHTGNDLIRSNNYRLWFRADSTLGKYKEAIKHYQLYKKHSDSVFNGEKSRQINSMQIEFETEQKDRNIQLLKQKAKLQETRIGNDKMMRYIFAGILFVLVLFAALLYNRSRLKNNANRKLEIKRRQIDEQNGQLKKLVTEKEWLLKEIHHRVKNNLQIVISLLNTQSAYLENEDALKAIQNSQQRMHTISLIHQKLYQTENLSVIDMFWYINALISYIKECYLSDQKIQFVLELDPVFLDTAQAVPIGLIINEAVNNAMKYAFPDGKSGEIKVQFKQVENNKYKLMIADNGVGLPENVNVNKTESLGMNLMQGLAAQLDGTFSLENKNGLEINVIFDQKSEAYMHQ